MTDEYKARFDERYRRMKSYKQFKVMNNWISKKRDQFKTTNESIKKFGSKINSWSNKAGNILGKTYKPFAPVIDKIRNSKTFQSGNIKESLRGNVLQKNQRQLTRNIKTRPNPIRKMAGLGGIALGATAMLSLSVLKGAMNASRETVATRYMEDMAFSKNILNTSRLGFGNGQSRMDMNSIMGLTNAMSRTRHG